MVLKLNAIANLKKGQNISSTIDPHVKEEVGCDKGSTLKAAAFKICYEDVYLFQVDIDQVIHSLHHFVNLRWVVKWKDMNKIILLAIFYFIFINFNITQKITHSSFFNMFKSVLCCALAEKYQISF